MSKNENEDWNLESLLLMNDQVIIEDDGYWYKIEARKVSTTPQRPHGVRYCLTLHDPDNERIYGIDNAHALKKASRSPGTKRRVEYDHEHEGKIVKVYEYKSAPDLLQDFFDGMDRVLKKERNKK